MRSLDSSELARSKSAYVQPLISLGIILERGCAKEMDGDGEKAKKSFNPSKKKRARNPVAKIKTFIKKCILGVYLYCRLLNLNL